MQTNTLISDWQWHKSEQISYLRCLLLEEWIHGFFTNQSFPMGPEELSPLLSTQATVHHCQQVHGNKIITPKELDRAADGIVSEAPLQSLWVASADCTPILIGDKQSGRVAAIHAGWRGTSGAIATEGVKRLLETGSQLKDLRIGLGPAISGPVYQVTETVAALTCQSLFPDLKSSEIEAVLLAARQLDSSPITEDPEPGRVKLDIRQVSYLQLLQFGLEPDQIAIAPFCTYQTPDHFFSYRRSREKKVQWSGIVSNN